MVKKLPERFSPIFFTGPSWSTEGDLIAATLARVGGASRVALFKSETGAEVSFSKEAWPYAGRVAWLPDMSGLLVIAGDGVFAPGLVNQLSRGKSPGHQRPECLSNLTDAWRSV